MGTGLDYAVIVAYFLAILLFGSWFGRFTNTTKDFFFGGQRFSWWLIAASCVATVVGSYSFVKYSAAGYEHGMCSSMGYLNDWIILPFFLFGWLPIIYWSRSGSIPEYFEKRFDRRTRLMATLVILLYMIGYIGINLLTLGVALEKILGVPLMPTVIILAMVSGIYLHFGGQTAVIFTDLLQAVILILAGFLLLGLGLYHLGGLGEFFRHLPLEHKLPFGRFNEPHSFSSVGVFWQDGVANNVAFYFMNQGVMMRFLSLKSVREGRKAMTFVVIVLMPLAMVAIANAGWLGRAFVDKGLLAEPEVTKDIFVAVAHYVAGPGVFGFIMAALTAALMSTVDTLVNAVSAIAVNDIYKPYCKQNADDRHYLRVAKLVAIAAAVVGVFLVPVFNLDKSIMEAHAKFTGAITPPMVIVILLGAFWKRFTPQAAFWTLVVGSGLVVASLCFPVLVTPFAHGVGDGGNYKYMRALYALVACLVVALLVTWRTRPKADIDGLVIDSVHKGMALFKGGRPKTGVVKPIRLPLATGPGEGVISLAPDAMARLAVEPGDLVYVRDRRWWYGGLKSAQAALGPPHAGVEVRLSADLVKGGMLRPGEEVVVERIL